MAWWAWLLLVWAVLAVASAVVLGRAIRMADRRELGQHQPGEEAGSGEAVPRHSPVSGGLRDMPRQGRR